MPPAFDPDELDDMLDPDGLGEEVSWTPTDEMPRPLNGIFEAHFAGVTIGATDYEGKTYTLTVKATDISGMKHKEVVTRQEVEYKVKGIHDEETGLVVIALKES